MRFYVPVPSQVHPLLLLRRPKSDQHWRSSGAYNHFRDFLSDVKLFHWRLCVLQFDWTGRKERWLEQK